MHWLTAGLLNLMAMEANVSRKELEEDLLIIAAYEYANDRATITPSLEPWWEEAKEIQRKYRDFS